jgi:hypothetical protein
MLVIGLEWSGLVEKSVTSDENTAFVVIHAVCLVVLYSWMPTKITRPSQKGKRIP